MVETMFRRNKYASEKATIIRNHWQQWFIDILYSEAAHAKASCGMRKAGHLSVGHNIDPKT